MRNKKRWEKKYENFKSPSEQARFEELKEKVQNKTISKKEYDEYQKMQKIKDNLPKVDNLRVFIDKLEEELEACKEEYNSRINTPNAISIEDLNKEMNFNMEKQDELIAKRKEINKKIEASTDEVEIAKLKEEKERINQDLSTLRFQADKNNREFARLQNEKPQKQQTNNKFSRYSNEQLRERCFQISSMISKCDMVATNLMKGLSVDNIKVKMQKWKNKKFTSKDPLPLTRKERMGNQQANPAQPAQNPPQPAQNPEQNPAQPPKVVDEFEKAFPRLAKRFPNMKDNFLGKALLKIKNFIKKEELDPQGSQPTTQLPNQDNPDQLPNQDNPDAQQNKKQNELFRDYLKYDVLEVAEKGVEQVRKDKIEQKKAQVAQNKSDGQTR